MKFVSQQKPDCESSPNAAALAQLLGTERKERIIMQSNNILGKQRQDSGKLSRGGATDAKDITMKTLAELKAKLYANADRAKKQNPSKADIIQKAVDRDASRIAYAINAVQVKM